MVEPPDQVATGPRRRPLQRLGQLPLSPATHLQPEQPASLLVFPHFVSFSSLLFCRPCCHVCRLCFLSCSFLVFASFSRFSLGDRRYWLGSWPWYLPPALPVTGVGACSTGGLALIQTDCVLSPFAAFRSFYFDALVSFYFPPIYRYFSMPRFHLIVLNKVLLSFALVYKLHFCIPPTGEFKPAFICQHFAT